MIRLLRGNVIIEPLSPFSSRDLFTRIGNHSCSLIHVGSIHVSSHSVRSVATRLENRISRHPNAPESLTPCIYIVYALLLLSTHAERLCEVHHEIPKSLSNAQLRRAILPHKRHDRGFDPVPSYRLLIIVVGAFESVGAFSLTF